jgi:hypothetical protein
MMRDLPALIGLSLLLAGLACLACRAAEPSLIRAFPVRWSWARPSVSSASHMRLPPWQRIAPERVAIDLSLDDGETWQQIAYGIPSGYGTNEYMMSVPDWPTTCSDYARTRIRCVRSVANPAPDVVSRRFTISGIHLCTPPTVVTNGVEVLLQWTSAGAGAFVQLGTRAPGDALWREDAIMASSDSIAGGITNQTAWLPVNLPVPVAMLVIQSVSDPAVSRIYQLQVREPDGPGGI